MINHQQTDVNVIVVEEFKRGTQIRNASLLQCIGSMSISWYVWSDSPANEQ